MNEIQRHMRSGHALFRVVAWEEEQAAAEVAAAARETLGAAVAVHEWDAAFGLAPPGGGESSLADVLDAAAAAAGPALYILRDAHHFLGEAAVVRRLRRLPGAIAARPVRVVLLSPPAELPAQLSHELPSASFVLPSFESMVRLVEEEAPDRLDPAISPRVVASALRGLTAQEARLALRRILVAGPIEESSLVRLFEEKATRIQGGLLEFFAPSIRMEDVGGLGTLKEWVAKRAPRIRRDNERGVMPRGLLLTGVSGCGKSYLVKALSRSFALPLFRLDMAQIFSRREPEGAFSQALSAVQTMSPCILWVDEIEDAFALGARDTGPASRIIGSFLTWLQERPEGIFVAATANRIERLPAQLLRRGRFDQIFFVDLPDEEERKRIWAIHLARRSANPARFDLIILSRSSAGWSGAEIEAAVDAAALEATTADEELAKEHLFHAVARTVPLAVTMKEQIKHVKEWAHSRALSASAPSR